jgi:hypothetical protein
LNECLLLVLDHKKAKRRQALLRLNIDPAKMKRNLRSSRGEDKVDRSRPLQNFFGEKILGGMKI